MLKIDMFKRAFIIGIFLNMPALLNLAAQDAPYPRYTFNGQVRHRFEVNDKDFDNNIDAVDFNLLRTRFGIQYLPIEHVEAFVQVQDSRTFGEESSTLMDGSADQLDLHQGYFKITNLFDSLIDLQIGRFEANYGSQRLIGAVGWHNIGRSFDGILARIHPEKATIDLYNFKIAESLTPGGEGSLNVMGVNGAFQLIENYTTQAFLIWQRALPTSELSRYTTGVFISGSSNNLKPEFELAYQGGERVGFDVSAVMVALNLGYTVTSSSVAPTFSAGIDYLSGDDDIENGDYKVFDTLYATNHKFYGFMDFFLNIPVHTMGLGLRDIHAKIAIKPQSNLSLSVALHNFSANKDFNFADGSTGDHFGNEVDFTFVFNYNKKVTFTGGAALFLSGEIFEVTRGSDNGAWAYLMTSVNL